MIFFVFLGFALHSVCSDIHLMTCSTYERVTKTQRRRSGGITVSDLITGVTCVTLLGLDFDTRSQPAAVSLLSLSQMMRVSSAGTFIVLQLKTDSLMVHLHFFGSSILGLSGPLWRTGVSGALHFSRLKKTLTNLQDCETPCVQTEERG